MRPLTLVYEDFQQDHAGTAARVLDYLGIEEPYRYDAGGISLERLSDDVTDEWAMRYMQEKRVE